MAFITSILSSSALTNIAELTEMGNEVASVWHSYRKHYNVVYPVAPTFISFAILAPVAAAVA